MSHYEFLKSVSLAWLDPEVYRKKLDPGPTRGRGVLNDDSSTTESERSSSTSTVAASTRSARAAASRQASKQICTRFTDASLDPRKGSLRCRLVTELGHHPEPRVDKPETNCQLHRYIMKKKCRAKLMFCSTCNCILCLECWKKFHQVEDLKALKHKF